MKQWYEYQLAEQITKPELNQIDYKPIANLAHLCPILNELKALREESYYRNFYRDANWPGLAAKNSDTLTEEQIREWLFEDERYKDYTEKNGINYIELPDSVRERVVGDIAKTLDLDPNYVTLVVNLQLPGQYFAMHVDRVKYDENGVKRSENAKTPYSRFLLFFDDWQHGQAFQLGDQFLKWRAGDIFTWAPEHVYHGSSNFGFHDRYILRIDVNYDSPWRLEARDK